MSIGYARAATADQNLSLQQRPGRSAEGELYLEAMQPLKAHVHNGRLVLDEPTDLPEGR